MFNVEDFKAKLQYGGARPNLFKIEITTWGGQQTLDGALGEKMSYLAKASSLPASTVAKIPVNFRGRIINVAGDRSFEDWTVTFYNDNDFSIRNKFEEWMHSYMNAHVGNIGPTEPNQYKADMSVHQLTKDGETAKIYKFVGAFPTSVASIGLDFGTENSIEEFEVTFAYDYWVDSSNNQQSTSE